MSVAAPLTVSAAFERVARWFAAEEAVIDSGSRLTFAQLDDLSRRAASVMAGVGVVSGQPVALLALPSTVFVVAWLGALRLGALPMALHSRESAATLAEICRSIPPRALLFDASLEPLAAELAGACGLPAIRLHSAVRAGEPRLNAVACFPADLAAASPDAPLHRAAEDDPAVISLSSGTTSSPKGIVHTQRSLTELARTDLYLYGGLAPGDRSLVPLSTVFIGCTNGWLPFLNAGAAAVFLEAFDLGRLLVRVSEERITHLHLTPTLWRRVLARDLSQLDLSSLRQIGFAAEVMDDLTLSRLRERISPNVVQMYGSTETGAAATCNFARDMTGPRLASVGRPMPNGDLRVVRPGGGPADEVPPGEEGEVLVTSPSLAAGIWGDPARTARAFVEAGGRRWWRSGDLGRVDEAGFLYIEGRHDDMIISGGINIMPARVENALLAHPDVAEVAVIGVADPGWGDEVRAVIVPRGAPPGAADLEDFLGAGALSPYQRPRRYAFAAVLPRTGTGKISRRELRAGAEDLEWERPDGQR